MLLISLAAAVLYSLTGWLLNPMIAAAATSLSSLFVLGSSLRLRRVAPAIGRRRRCRNAEPEAVLASVSSAG